MGREDKDRPASEEYSGTTSAVAEFSALKREPKLVLENGWTDLWLEGDAKIIVDIIAKRGKLKYEEAKKKKHVNYINIVMPRVLGAVF
ncbi:hypothetical protein F2Q68_00037284 [Brassica cretica]|uniref:RNase H type-1 domain-containing protein n=2 Tax=Brassica cretica TaxID=69181 RepID=A0A8S9HDI0_BRACR|nr:hypothetical protein F2Q68_00037284 [Brassica cretica]KAF3595656.1 hypothetical protein DY000_02027087 [Brassica cretica]